MRCVDKVVKVVKGGERLVESIFRPVEVMGYKSGPLKCHFR